MLKDKELFIKQNGEVLASRKGRQMLWPPCHSPTLLPPPEPSPGPSLSQWRGRTVWTLLLRGSENAVVS